MLISDIWQFLINGVGLSCLYALFAVGLTLIFGVMKIIIFAYGELYMIGAYVIYVVLRVGSDLIPIIPLFFIGLVLAVLFLGGIGVMIERGIFRPLRQKWLAGFLASLGLLYILQVSVGQIFGIEGMIVPVVFPGALKLAGAYLSIDVLVVIITAVILLGLLWFFLGRTRLGRGVRASSQDAEAATMQGINQNRMSALAMGIGSALAGIAGALVGSTLYLNPYIGWGVLWKAFVITIVGGMGSIGGAIVASLLFGFLDNLVTVMGEPQLVVMVDVLIMLGILAFRPEGLLGHER